MKKSWVLLISLLFLFPSVVQAPLDISMAPPKLEFHLKPKKKVREVIEIENRGFKPVRLKVYVTGFSIQENGDLVFSRDSHSAEKWIKVTPSEMTIKPYDFGTVRYEIAVPEGALKGSCTASIMIEEVLPPEDEQKKTQFIIKGRMAHIVYVNIGKPDYRGQIGSFQIAEESGLLKYSIKIKNDGDYYFRTRGRLTIQQDNKKVKEIPLPNIPILCHAERNLEFTVAKDDLAPGEYAAFLSLDIGSKTPLQAKAEFSIPERIK